MINSQEFRRDKCSDFFLSEYLSAEILPNPKFLVFRFFLKNQLSVNLIINNAFPPLDPTLQ